MRKGIITLTVVAIIVILLAGLGPVVYRYATDEGVRTANLGDGSGEPASVGVDGHWSVVEGIGANHSQAGYTFDEVLPGQRKSTSGRGTGVEGSFVVRDGRLTEGEVTVQVDSISSDIEKRDINVRNHILQSDRFPTARFTVRSPVDVSALPADGTAGSVTVPGTLTLHGRTHDVSPTMKVLRSGDHVIMESHIPVTRDDYGLQSPQFVASDISQEGTIDVLLVLSSQDARPLDGR
ncbi:YceI family protein [Corynebacterium bovis]|uniref:YceI family protein n=1 Tax=Corynebacterium bovis TaxID=36808 RepID=UPI00244BF293|nr:YceI family protein [Corynebacterium bovis]MDH2454926.1 YceI family protein [Corynebacterium bovis]